jgi:hypothetical protein
MNILLHAARVALMGLSYVFLAVLVLPLVAVVIVVWALEAVERKLGIPSPLGPD